MSFVTRVVPRSLVMQCPCGCGDVFSVNLDPRVGPAWLVYQTSLGLTVYPSIWRESGCRSHFIVWNSRVIFMGAAGEWFAAEASADLQRKVLRALGLEESKHFTDLARDINEVPWDVLMACRSLAAARLLREGQPGVFAMTHLTEP